MKTLSSFLTKPGIVFGAVAVASALIILSFINFRVQVDAFIDKDMYAQIEAIQKNSTQLMQNEMSYLKQVTETGAQMMSRTELETDEDILRILRDYADVSKIVRTLFITMDGHTYTSYAGYLGQSEANTSIDGISISEITTPIFSQPYYAQDLGEVIFGVIAPVVMGRKQGVLVSSYNIEEFSELLGNKLIDGSAEIGIINQRGEVVLGRSVEEFRINIFDALKPVPFEQASAEMMRADCANGKSGFSVYRVDNVARYCAYAPVGLNDWCVIVVIKEDSLRKKLASLERYGFQLTVELVAVMLGLLIFIMANRLREQKRIRAILEQAARLDGLTDIYNRKATEEAIEQSLQADAEALSSVLLVIDVDDFKQINDQGGHLLGDRALKECADQLNRVFGDEGIIGRIGGDEFVVFIRDGRDIARIEEQINRLIDHFHITTKTGGKQKLSISVGIAQAEPETSSFLTLYQLADAALYRAKEAGKGRLSK